MLNHPQIKYPTGNIFYQLVSLELDIDEINVWNLLSFMLDSSPKLQILKLDGVSSYSRASFFIYFDGLISY